MTHPVQTTVHFPDALWRAVQSLEPHEGDTNTLILCALEDYITARSKRRARQRSGKNAKLVKGLSTPVVDLHLSARLATALRTLNIRYVYELVQKSPVDLFPLPHFGEKSLREGTAKLAGLGLTHEMTLDGQAYADAALATLVTNV